MRHQHNPASQHARQTLFEHMPILDDEAIWDLLETLCALIDAYEDHYAEQLQRLRLKRYRELHEEAVRDNQLHLSLHEWDDDPF
jgi:hypothetical protein